MNNITPRILLTWSKIRRSMLLQPWPQGLQQILLLSGNYPLHPVETLGSTILHKSINQSPSNQQIFIHSSIINFHQAYQWWWIVNTFNELERPLDYQQLVQILNQRFKSSWIYLWIGDVEFKPAVAISATSLQFIKFGPWYDWNLSYLELLQ